MIERGILYYDIESISQKLFSPVIAKELEIILKNEELDLSDPDIQPKLSVGTEKLSFFKGNYQLLIIPTKIIELFMLKEHYNLLVGDPILSENESLKLEKERVTNELYLLQDIAEKDVWSNKSFIIAYSEDKSIYFVKVGIPKDIKPFLTDERIYELEDGQTVKSEDGLPLFGVYYYQHDGLIKYTSDPSKGKHVGE